jgi:hypothetical protein
MTRKILKTIEAKRGSANLFWNSLVAAKDISWKAARAAEKITGRHFWYPRAHIGIELSGYCNLSCAMCPHKSMQRKKGFMDLGLFKRIVDMSRESRFPIGWLHVFGDPLLYPGLKEALKYFRENGFGRGELSTNGMLINNQNIGFIIEYAKVIHVALDSTDAVAYRTLRNGGDHATVIGNIKRLIARSKGSGPKIEIQWLKTKLNENEGIPAFERLFGVHENVEYVVKEAVRYGAKTEDFRAGAGKADVKKCPMPYWMMSIAWNGDCMFCCFDCEFSQKIGNAAHDTLPGIWKGKTAETLRRRLRRGDFTGLPFCKDCLGPN